MSKKKVRYFFYACKEGALIYAKGEHKYGHVILAIDDDSDSHYQNLLKAVTTDRKKISKKTPLYEISKAKAADLNQKGNVKRFFVPLGSHDQLFQIKNKLNALAKEDSVKGAIERLQEAEALLASLRKEVGLAGKEEAEAIDEDHDIPGLPEEKEPDILAFDVDANTSYDDLPDGVEDGDELPEDGEDLSLEIAPEEDPLDLDVPKKKKLIKKKKAK